MSRTALQPIRATGALEPYSRLVLTIGFGGLLLLTIFAGFNSIGRLRQIQTSNDPRIRLLEQIRSDLHLPNTDVLDYLLEPKGTRAKSHRASPLKTRNGTETALQRYKALLDEEHAASFRMLIRELQSYRGVPEPVFTQDTGGRRDRGYAFLRDEVFPHRMAMLRIADQTAGMNESQLNAGEHGVIEMFSVFRSRSILVIGPTIAVGLLLAVLCMGKIVRFELDAAARCREIAAARAERKQPSARLAGAQKNERCPISRELHDQAGQALTGVCGEWRIFPGGFGCAT